MLQIILESHELSINDFLTVRWVVFILIFCVIISLSQHLFSVPSFSWFIHVEEKVTSNWTCSEQLVTVFKMRPNRGLWWECWSFSMGWTLLKSQKYFIHIYHSMFDLDIHPYKDHNNIGKLGRSQGGTTISRYTSCAYQKTTLHPITPYLCFVNQDFPLNFAIRSENLGKC